MGVALLFNVYKGHKVGGGRYRCLCLQRLNAHNCNDNFFSLLLVKHYFYSGSFRRTER